MLKKIYVFFRSLFSLGIDFNNIPELDKGGRVAADFHPQQSLARVPALKQVSWKSGHPFLLIALMVINNKRSHTIFPMRKMSIWS